jgi:hypothetical protein
MANPLIAQGTLNRLRASVVFTSFPQLNITSSYLGKAGISMGFEGEYTTFIDTMTGAVTSPEPYVRVMLRINLLKTQALANAYKAQAEQSTLLGDLTVRPDATTLDPYPLINSGFANVGELSFAGGSADWMLSLHCYYNINAALFSN